MKKILLATAATAAALAVLPATAAGWYAGGAISQTFGQVNTGRIDSDLRTLGFSSASVTADTKDIGGRVFLGRHLLPWLGAEAYYADLGDNGWNAVVTPTGTLNARTESKAYGVVLMPGWSPAKGVLVYGRLGIARTEAKSSFASTGFVELESSSRKDTTTAGVYGVGVAWMVAGKAFLRVDLDSHDNLGSNEIGGKFKARAASVGLGFAF